MSNLFNEIFGISGARKQSSVGVMDVKVDERKGEGTMKKNKLKIFENAEFGQIRTVEVDGEPYFVANDIAKALGYSNPSKATNDHCKKAIMVWGNDSLGRRQEFKVIPEGDIYRLVVKSQLPSAERFESWVFDDVLPDVRKNGSYSILQKTSSHNIQIPSSVNTAAKILKDTYADAGVDPKFIAVAVGNLYKESTGYDAGIPLISEDTQLYDKTSIAEKFGICSKSGKPHPQAVGAIISQLEVAEDECVNTPYNRHGHSGVDVQYKESVCDKVEGWLELHAYPDEIMSESGKKLKVNYRGDV